MELDQIIKQLLDGAIVTLQMCLLAIPLATALGVLLGIMKNSGIQWLRAGISSYIWIMRSIPLLLLLFFVYFALPEMTGGRIPAFTAAVASLTLHGAAYVGEIVYGSVRSVHRGQWAAARSLGLGFFHMSRSVIGPQALRVALPPIISTYTIMVKESSLAAVIGHVDLLGAALAMRESQIALAFGVKVLAMAAAFYFAICFALSTLGRIVERKQLWTSRNRPITTEVLTNVPRA